MKKNIYAFLFLILLISSCKLKEDITGTDSDNNGTSTTTIKVITPNGNEVLSEGSSYQITWSGTGTSHVKIQYSIDNGTSWSLIVDSLKNSGVFSWFPIPNTISNQCRLQITSLDGKSTDASDNVFSIIRNSNQSIKVSSPKEKEEWEGGSAKQIKWFSSGIDSVKIEYTTNNGIKWNLVTVDKKNTGIYYWEPVPNTPSTLARVRIMDAKDGEPSSESELFNLLPEPKITVLSPNGGEKLYTGSKQNIEWVAENIENVKISYTTNNGATWSVIVQSTANTGFYQWTPIPLANSNLCKIRIEDSKDGQPYDLSNSEFSITNQTNKSLKLTSPVGGEKWVSGSTVKITWESSGIKAVKLEYTTDDGVLWNLIKESWPSITANDRTFTWSDIPNVAAPKCKIKITDVEESFFTDSSPNYFSISKKPSVKVLRPNGGETYYSGMSQELRWESENIGNVKIEYTVNGGEQWITLATSVNSNGAYIWENIPNVYSFLCKIRVSDVMNGTPSDESDNFFAINNAVNKSIEVKSPNGGEDWEAGTRQNITWVSSAINKIKIELTTDKGSKWITLADNVTGGAFEWKVPDNYNSTQCQIRLSDASDSKVSDLSDGAFTITPRKWIIVTAPLARVYRSDELVTISWQSGGIKNVGIKYTTTNGVADINNPAFTDLAVVGAAMGTYSTYFSKPSDKYFVVVYNADENSEGLPSNNSPGFTVVKAEIPSITLLAPNGKEQWLGNPTNVSTADYQNYHPYEIKWIGDNTNKVKIEWTSNGGGTWYTIPGADSTENDGSFTWAPGRLDPIRPDSSDNCKIRIKSVGKSIEISDMSDDVFSIHRSKKLRVDYPNKGQDFYPPEDLSDPKPSEKWPMLISWTSYAIQTVHIYYSLDNGVTWQTLATNYQSTGAFSWDFVFGALAERRVSTQGLIKIVDASDSKVWDVNDIPFWLNVMKTSGKIINEQNKTKGSIRK